MPRALHAAVSIREAKGGSTAALYVESIGGKHGEAKAESEAGKNSPLLSSRAVESGRVSNQAEAGRQTQLRSRARVCLPSLAPGGKEACRASVRAWAECWKSAHSAS
jgi:hypothetical protein